MKKLIILFALTLFISGCNVTPITTVTDRDSVSNTDVASFAPKPSSRQDWYMVDAEAIKDANSNNGQPPAGWQIVCDNKGHYACEDDSGRVHKRDLSDEYWLANDVRTNAFEASVVAWKLYNIFNAPTPEYKMPGTEDTNDFEPCN
jgi:hypothetical protein